MAMDSVYKALQPRVVVEMLTADVVEKLARDHDVQINIFDLDKIKNIERPYMCSDCSKAYKHQYQLTRHHRTVHLKTTEFRCEICERLFLSKSHLLEHSQTHARGYKGRSSLRKAAKAMLKDGKKSREIRRKLPNVICVVEKCGKKLTSQKSLDNHMKTVHARGEYPFQCSDCGKRFKRLHRKNAHHRFFHLGIQDYICHFCGKGFCHQNAMNRHILTHKPDDEKILQCSVCSHKVKTPEGLKYHMKIVHENSGGQYFCEHCGKRFNSSSHLYTHIQGVHQDPSNSIEFNCHLCSRSFKIEKYMHQHFRRKHKITGVNTIPSKAILE